MSHSENIKSLPPPPPPLGEGGGEKFQQVNVDKEIYISNRKKQNEQ